MQLPISTNYLTEHNIHLPEPFVNCVASFVKLWLYVITTLVIILWVLIFIMIQLIFLSMLHTSNFHQTCHFEILILSAQLTILLYQVHKMSLIFMLISCLMGILFKFNLLIVNILFILSLTKKFAGYSSTPYPNPIVHLSKNLFPVVSYCN